MSQPSLDDVALNVEVAGTGEPLLLLHGFTGSTETWKRYMGNAPFQCIAVDLPGHGRSDSPQRIDPYGIDRTVEALLRSLTVLAIDRVSVLGYSLGGRIAMHLALAAPLWVDALLLESASPGIEDPVERERRMLSDRTLADEIERDGVSVFVDRWERMPLFQSQERLSPKVRAALRQQRLSNTSHGLANSLRGAGAGMQMALWNRLSELRMPVLLLAGALDIKYAAIAQRMLSALPHAELAIVPDVGHAVHLEAPEEFDTHVTRFLTQVSKSRPGGERAPISSATDEASVSHMLASDR